MRESELLLEYIKKQEQMFDMLEENITSLKERIAILEHMKLILRFSLLFPNGRSFYLDKIE